MEEDRFEAGVTAILSEYVLDWDDNDASLVFDLGLDSIDLLEIAGAIEERFGIEHFELMDIETVNELIDAVRNQSQGNA